MTDTTWAVLLGGMLFLIGGLQPTFAQECVPHASAAVPIDGDATGADDWDSIEKLTLTYGPATTHLVTDATYLYFLTEVTTSLSDPDQQTFVLGAEASNGLRVRPFQASDTAPEGPNSNLWQLDEAFGNWAWTGGAPANADFQRVLLGSPERWVLEGRLTLSGLSVSDRNSFDLFLHVAVGTSGSALHYWPSQGSGFVDVADPSGLTFGEVRCPDASFSEPYVSFGKQEIGGSSTLSVDVSNGGASGSTLSVSSIALDPTGAPFTITGGSTPPTLTTSDSPHTITLQYAPTSGTTIGAPHETELVITSNDPDDSETRLPVQGHARDAIQFVFILDQSGSMLGTVDGVGKWDATKWATNVAYESMRLYSADNDRVGSVWFGGPSSTPQSGVLSALAPFGTNPLDYAGTFTQQAQSDFFTPIGLGLEEGHDLFSGTVRHVGLLMSDGLHNRPTQTSGAEVVADLNLPSAVESNTKSMEIFTVAFGTESSVSTELLDDISQHFGGGGTTYNIQDAPEDLAEAFIEPFMEPMIVNRIAPTSTTSLFDFPVEQNAEAVVGMVVWGPTDTPADIKVDVYDEMNSTLVKTYTSSSSEATYHKGSGSGQPYTYLFVDDVEEFDQNYTWRIRTPSGAIPGTAANLAVPVVLVDLNVRALFDATQDERAGTGDVYRLTADLEEVGRPITGSSVDVRARLRKPAEGLGTLASTVNLDDCSVQEPTLPPPIRVTDDVVRNDDVIQQLIQRRLSARPMQFDTRRVVAAAAQQVADPGSYRTNWATAYEARCGPLARTTDPGLALVDDGTQGDAVAGDGIFTLDYSSTDYEGTYVVTFTAQGESPTGARFSRTRTMASYVPVMIDPLVTQFNWRDLGESNNIVLREYFVVPQSSAGEYLGPDKGSFVEFTINGANGTFVSDVVDYRNGIYSQLVRYNKQQGTPDVSVTVRGTTVAEPSRGGVRGAELVLFVGHTVFDNTLRLDDGWGIGGRAGIPLLGSRKLFGELELASTLTNVTSADTVRLAQVLGNLRYDVIETRPRVLSPFVTVGGGIGRVWGEGANETVALLHAGGGLSYYFSRTLGVRVTARALRLSSVRGADAPINLQLTGGIVFRPRP